MLYIKLNAGHTTNGNPRRVFVVYTVVDGEMKAIDGIDEGYMGDHEVRAKYPNHVYGGEFATTVQQYRKILKGEF